MNIYDELNDLSDQVFEMFVKHRKDGDIRAATALAEIYKTITNQNHNIVMEDLK